MMGRGNIVGAVGHHGSCSSGGQLWGSEVRHRRTPISFVYVRAILGKKHTHNDPNNSDYYTEIDALVYTITHAFQIDSGGIGWGSPFIYSTKLRKGNTVFRGVKSKGYPHPPPPPNSHTALHTDWRPLHTPTGSTRQPLQQ